MFERLTTIRKLIVNTEKTFVANNKPLSVSCNKQQFIYPLKVFKET